MGTLILPGGERPLSPALKALHAMLLTPKDTAEIAAELGIKSKSVIVSASEVYARLGVRSRHELQGKEIQRLRSQGGSGSDSTESTPPASPALRATESGPLPDTAGRIEVPR